MASESIRNSVRNQILEQDSTFHGWYRFVLGYPPHLVRQYVDQFGIDESQIVLDPFCGTGTTNVECLKLGIHNVGVEANPMAYFASRVKTNWDVPVPAARDQLYRVVAATLETFRDCDIHESSSLDLKRNGAKPLRKLPSLNRDQEAIIPKGFINPSALRKVLILRELISRVTDEQIRDLFLLALASVTVSEVANIAFGPEIYVTSPKHGVRVVDPFRDHVECMLSDLEGVPVKGTKALIEWGDAREMGKYLQRFEKKIKCVITSPPYPNEKDYTRTTRLESVILGLVNDKAELRRLKEGLLRSNSRNIFVGDSDGEFVKDFRSIRILADSIEAKRIELGKTSGFEKLYHKIVRHYFGGMHRHLSTLQPYLVKGAKLAYVVGDQMSFFRTHIKTADLLAEIATKLGYKVTGIDLWRTRLATATKTQLNENVLLLQKR